MDRPTLDELLEATAEFLEREILPTLADPRLRFQTLVALNALGIARRELALWQGLMAEDQRALATLLGREGEGAELLGELAHRIRQGQAPEGTFAFLKAHVARKLRVASPRYLERYP
ncbi:DUF6285 domain-containing protein [Thermus thermamylovorans]|uniref:DUF6285 domain-containing protein n=1 Tax=Thermus thermamylovorans TaxID=2509362 RepID=A0A4Q9B9X6_9DEIN|nr:DUF6285 domain-containing protein [Thermus thermamylovorans]TBH21823.1 hypothetical protein ETP66_00865 [Thermus thermamylovorans]